jgi:hypothetical protein
VTMQMVTTLPKSAYKGVLSTSPKSQFSMYENLGRRMAFAKQWKDNWLALNEQLYWWVIPNRNALNDRYSYISDGTPLTTTIYDSTAMLGAYQRANDLHGLVMPMDRTWGRLTFNPHRVSKEEVTANQAALDAENNKIFWYINQSNLSRVVASSNLDLCGGTACIFAYSKSDDEPLCYYSVPSINVFLEHTYDDTIDTVWFKRNFNSIQFLEEFPGYGGVMADVARRDPTAMIPVIYGQIKQADDGYLFYAVCENDPMVPLFETERGYKQLIVYRDRVRPGESDGRGVALDLLPTIQDLNHVVRDHRKILAFTALPPMFYDESQYFNPNSIAQWAGAFIPTGAGGRDPIRPLNMPNTVPDVFNQIMDLRQTVKQAFQVDPLGDVNTPFKTATEVSAREQRAQRTTVTDIGRLQNELPKAVYEISTRILIERKLVNLKDLDKRFLHFKFESPLHDLQKQAQLNNFIQNSQVKQQFFGEGAVLGSVNIGKVSTFLTECLNLPAELYKTEEELMAAMQQMGQQGQPAPSTSAIETPSADAQQIERINVDTATPQR